MHARVPWCPYQLQELVWSISLKVIASRCFFTLIPTLLLVVSILSTLLVMRVAQLSSNFEIGSNSIQLWWILMNGDWTKHVLNNGFRLLPQLTEKWMGTYPITPVCRPS